MRACIAFQVKDILEIKDKDMNGGEKKNKNNNNCLISNQQNLNKNGIQKIKIKN
jgi:hypothetical protein